MREMQGNTSSDNMESVTKNSYDVAILEQRREESSGPLTEYLAEKAK